MRTVLHMHTLIIHLSELHAEILMFKILIIQLSELHAELLMFNTLIIHPSERHAYASVRMHVAIISCFSYVFQFAYSFTFQSLIFLSES